ncbi:formylglycine-generating enzyme family protein [Acaryochloris marina]|uniref:formylglycine-generating enzyme family protein n=1 Tax=Acaryochloris marina TaxID=155978 RepID=UPI00220B43EF|nr:formylglycine-generating enzyme family protein [Acaryochloris marina]BDM83544.1 hypothetical protein AM10699_64050 [Acaryochloris marina MBIC10699]
MFEGLIALGGAELGRFVLQKVLTPFSKKVLENYVSDFFKESLSSGVATYSKPLQQAVGQSVGEFIKLFVDELEDHNVPKSSINHFYYRALTQYVKDSAVRPLLGQAFDIDVRQVDAKTLAQAWKVYQPEGWSFPQEFNWDRLAKEYSRRVRGIIRADPELERILKAELAEKRKEVLEDIRGLNVGFDFSVYQFYQFNESLETSEQGEVSLDMVMIPGGKFLMGSHNGESERSDSEGPQHWVSVLPFFMGKYAVTQAQWKVVASWERVNRDLNPTPSSFIGYQRPVEQISWEDAIEFCERLSHHTGREYSLPSEAEWEYACRAGTQTPFHFGETITTELANYNGTATYSNGPEGEYRQQTTNVGSFSPNGFGLYDMHGNVWESCLDTWHENYEGAPTDGSAWIDNTNNFHVVRGGSWIRDPRSCRCAYRDRNQIIGYPLGFRVVCRVPSTL